MFVVVVRVFFHDSPSDVLVSGNQIQRDVLTFLQLRPTWGYVCACACVRVCVLTNLNMRLM